jgi:hypothetical protein
MRRREFIAGVAGAAAWPVLARAQQGTVSVIGYLSPEPASDVDFSEWGVDPVEIGLVASSISCRQSHGDR